MNRTLVLLVSLAALAGCTHAQGTTTEPSAAPAGPGSGDTQKTSAPVEVTAELGRGTAKVQVRFDAPGSNVRVDVKGVDGLVVSSAATPVSEATVKQAEVRALDVAFAPGQGRSHLVVSVAGVFGGASLNRVVSFAVGEPTAAQRTSPGTVITGSDGERVKVQPAE